WNLREKLSKIGSGVKIVKSQHIMAEGMQSAHDAPEPAHEAQQAAPADQFCV
ncbi:hypothetical protein A2U01_0094241, partial [Trifolium medium]|nr:hypothetical protein [Trifolium medium]